MKNKVSDRVWLDRDNPEAWKAVVDGFDVLLTEMKEHSQNGLLDEELMLDEEYVKGTREQRLRACAQYAVLSSIDMTEDGFEHDKQAIREDITLADSWRFFRQDQINRLQDVFLEETATDAHLCESLVLFESLVLRSALRAVSGDFPSSDYRERTFAYANALCALSLDLGLSSNIRPFDEYRVQPTNIDLEILDNLLAEKK